MLSFLPEQLKKSVKKEYYARVLILSLGIICLLLIYSISIILPIYTSSLFEKNRLTEGVQSIDLDASNCTKSGIDCTDPTPQIKSINLLLSILNVENRASVSAPLLEILNVKNNDIKISSIKYLGEAAGQYKFSINGVSLNREGLLAFVSDLKKNSRFIGINLPISDFVKSTNINFVLMINVKK